MPLAQLSPPKPPECVSMIRSSLMLATITSGMCLAFVGGCGMDIDPAMLTSVNSPTVSIDDEESSSVLSERTTQASTKNWAPSNPMRGNPFRYPGDTNEMPDAPQRDSTKTSHVSVVGFANVSRPVVMLKIRDESYSLAVGERHHGIEVTNIAPPKVTLQMSNLVWTISMFDKSTR